MNPVLQKYIDRQKRLMTFLWISHFPSYGIYYYIVNNEARAFTDPPGQPSVLFALLSLIFVIAGISMSHAAFSSDKMYKRTIRPVILPPGMQDLSEPEKRIHKIVTDSYTYFMISLGSVHTCAIFGLISSMMSCNNQIYLIHGATAVIGAIFCRPRVDRLLESLNHPGM
ncbi:hypothetical protein JW948_14220 [bacterium]|nr:hypothetical protein [bacterium]